MEDHKNIFSENIWLFKKKCYLVVASAIKWEMSVIWLSKHARSGRLTINIGPWLGTHFIIFWRCVPAWVRFIWWLSAIQLSYKLKQQKHTLIWTISDKAKERSVPVSEARVRFPVDSNQRFQIGSWTSLVKGYKYTNQEPYKKHALVFIEIFESNTKYYNFCFLDKMTYVSFLILTWHSLIVA